MRRIVLGIALLLAGAYMAASRAQIPPDPNYRCSLYFDGDLSVPGEVQAELRKQVGSAIEKCGYIQNPRSSAYFVASPVWRSDRGVCHFEITKFFLLNSRRVPWPERSYFSSSRWGWTEHMWHGAGMCPRQDERAYIAVENVSDGIFREIIALWTEIASNESAFDQAFELMDSCAGHPLSTVKEAFLHWRGVAPLTINSIRLQLGGVGGVSSSNVFIADVGSEGSDSGFNLWIDRTGPGLRVLNCTTWVV